MRSEKASIFESAKDAVLGYATLVLSFVVFLVVLWVIMIAVRVVAG